MTGRIPRIEFASICKWATCSMITVSFPYIVQKHRSTGSINDLTAAQYGHHFCEGKRPGCFWPIYVVIVSLWRISQLTEARSDDHRVDETTGHLLPISWGKVNCRRKYEIKLTNGALNASFRHLIMIGCITRSGSWAPHHVRLKPDKHACSKYVTEPCSLRVMFLAPSVATETILVFHISPHIAVKTLLTVVQYSKPVCESCTWNASRCKLIIFALTVARRPSMNESSWLVAASKARSNGNKLFL